mmetsp:Transcript_26874/g.36246  ORF Transcript_26874/g.36246 Transcript_26874/m.36246 type:complete len:175 (+) Transcript_26874:47-571(+)
MRVASSPVGESSAYAGGAGSSIPAVSSLSAALVVTVALLAAADGTHGVLHEEEADTASLLQAAPSRRVQATPVTDAAAAKYVAPGVPASPSAWPHMTAVLLQFRNVALEAGTHRNMYVIIPCAAFGLCIVGWCLIPRSRRRRQSSGQVRAGPRLPPLLETRTAAPASNRGNICC